MQEPPPPPLPVQKKKATSKESYDTLGVIIETWLFLTGGYMLVVDGYAVTFVSVIETKRSILLLLHW